MPKLEFDYQPFPSFDPKTDKRLKDIFRPFVAITFSCEHKVSRPIRCLLDSGADINLFPAELAESMGIKVDKGKDQQVRGIGNSIIYAYRHPVIIFFQNQMLKTTADFGLSQTDPLLGREGFFNFFKSVTFLQKERKFILDL